MGIGLGIVLGVVGAILLTGAVGIPGGWPIDNSALGWILLIAGVLAIVLALVMNQQRTRSTRREAPRHDDPPREPPPR